MQAFNLDVLWYWRSQVQSLLVESAVIQALRLGRSLSSHWFWEGRTESPGECAVFLASEEWWEMLPSSLLLPPTCRKDWRNQSRQDTNSKPPGTQHFWGAPGWKPHNAELHIHATTPHYPSIKHTSSCEMKTWNKTSSRPRIGVKQQGVGAGRDTQNSNSPIGSPFSLH